MFLDLLQHLNGGLIGYTLYDATTLLVSFKIRTHWTLLFFLFWRWNSRFFYLWRIPNLISFIFIHNTLNIFSVKWCDFLDWWGLSAQHYRRTHVGESLRGRWLQYHGATSVLLYHFILLVISWWMLSSGGFETIFVFDEDLTWMISCNATAVGNLRDWSI